jgi:hypothetical protein
MLERTDSGLLELDKAFQHAVTLAWDDLITPIEPRAIRVEYLWEPGSPLEHLSVWSVRAGGYQDLVCDFRASASLAHPSGACFGNRHSSEKLAVTLDFIMKNQGQFTRPADAGRHGLVLLYPPEANDRAEASAWMKRAQPLGFEVSPEEAHQQGATRQYATNQSRLRQRRTRRIISNCAMPGQSERMLRLSESVSVDPEES